MTLDPIVSLAVAIAETPGSYAFLLGSGVSRDAGVPTGGQVLWRAIGDLHRLENPDGDPPDEEGLERWLQETGRAHLDYSGVLELLAPLPEERRAYLAKYFEGREPGATHQLLASLAERGLARVFITTNFDRLFEAALRARGLEPVTVTAAADLEVVPAREHARVYLLKVHGDYLQQTIRNTRHELAELEPAMAQELQEVLDRYGLVVLGYSGSDPAIAKAMRARRSPYGLYWVAREGLGPEAKASLEASAGRVIERPDASAFLRDLDRRISAFITHPSGQTPVAVYDEVLLLLRRGDTVGLDELLRAERRPLREELGELLAERVNTQPEPAATEVHGTLAPLLERRLASLVPLLRHDTDRFAREFQALEELLENPSRPSGFTFWIELGLWPVWWLGYALGAVAVREQAWPALGALLQARAPEPRRGEPVPLVQSMPGEPGAIIGEQVLPKGPQGRAYIAPSWMLLRRDLAACSLTAERLPELATAGEPQQSLDRFSFLHCAYLGLINHRALAYWTMGGAPVETFARRLRADARTRAHVAEAMEVTLEGFDGRVGDALRAARPLGSFPDLDAIGLLEGAEL